MKNGIVLEVGGTAPDFAVSIADMEQGVTSYKEEQKL